jgi:hypothetical protein
MLENSILRVDLLSVEVIAGFTEDDSSKIPRSLNIAGFLDD